MTDERIKQEDEMNCGLTIAEHAYLQSRLKELPDTMPPRAVLQRIETQARAEGLSGRAFVPERLRWLASAGIAAAVVLAVLRLPNAGGPSGQETTASADALPTVPTYQESTDEVRLRSINALMVQSQVLERDLRRLPNSPRVMRASTAATIDDLQSRVAAIDYQLSHPGIQMTRQEQEMYWRERVRLMDSLVQLRYAQAQRGSF